MKKIKHILLFLIFLANTNFANAKGGYFPYQLLYIAGYGASFLSAVPLAATPYLFKDEDIEYSYSTTLEYSMLYALTIPLVAGLTKDDRLFFTSLFVAPVLGMVVGFNVSKKKIIITSTKNKARKGWYGGLGIQGNSTDSMFESSKGYNAAYHIEIGYGITRNLLIHYSVDTNYDDSRILAEIGTSYYISDIGYIKAAYGVTHTPNRESDNTEQFDNSSRGNASSTSIGYGHIISKRTAVEFTYTSSRSFYENTLGVSFNYRWF